MNNNEYSNYWERIGYKRGFPRGVIIGMIIGAAAIAFVYVICLMFVQSAQPPQNIAKAQTEQTCKVQMQFGLAETHQYTGKIQRAALN